MTDLQKLVERWAREAQLIEKSYDGDDVCGVCGVYMAQIDRFTALARLAMQYAAEEAAKVCENLDVYVYDECTSQECAHVIREHFKSL